MSSINFISDLEIRKLNLKQIELDILTLINLNKYIQDKPYRHIFGLNFTPYISMTIFEAYSYIKKLNLCNHTAMSENEKNRLFDSRLKIKFFDKDRFAENVILINNIELLNTMYFDNCPRFNWISKVFNLDNMGVFFIDGDYVGNSQLTYLQFQSKDLYQKTLTKSEIKCIKSIINGEKSIELLYKNKDYSLDKLYKESYQLAFFCGQKAVEIYTDVKFNVSNDLVTTEELRRISTGNFVHEEFCNTSYFSDLSSNILYKDINTKTMKKALFVNSTSEENAITIYLMHLYCMLNFVAKVFNRIVPNNVTYSLRVKFNCVHYVVSNLNFLYNYFMGNKLLNNRIKQFEKIFNNDYKFMFKNKFCNYIRHYDFIDNKGNIIISSDKFDINKPYYGAIESCFHNINYDELHELLDERYLEINELLKEWLNIY